MPDPHDSKFLDDPEFQSLLVACMESLQRGETIDRAALARDFPKFAAEVAQFLNDRQLLEQVASEFQEAEPSQVAIAACEKTMVSNPGSDDFAAGNTIRYIGDYEILEEIARGGMGVVFKARQQTLKRIIALKMILAGRLADPSDVERFQREARAAGRLKHANIVPVHEIGEHEGRHYFTMDFVEGRSLAEVIRQETLAPRTAAELVRTSAEAVQYAHEQGTVHRDLKPANVLLDTAGQPQITDFGLAKLLESVDEESRADLTASGQILGTPSYMSPEQAAGKQNFVGRASDIYSLGAVLYACLTGRAPFVADSPVDTLLQVMHNEPVSPRWLSPAVPLDLETICLKCLSKEPHKRYGTAQQLAEDLGRFLEGRPVVARPVSAVGSMVRWMRRNKLVAALLTVILLVFVAGTATSAILAVIARRNAVSFQSQFQRSELLVTKLDDSLQVQRALTQQTENQRQIADERTAEAEQQRIRAEDSTQHLRATLYAAHMNLVQTSVEAADIRYAVSLLNRHVPEEGTRDLRRFDWYYWWKRTHRWNFKNRVQRDGVRALNFSTDGRALLAVGRGDLRGTPVEEFPLDGVLSKSLFDGDDGGFSCVRFDQSGRSLVASPLYTGTVKLWNLKSGLVAEFPGHPNSDGRRNAFVSAVAISPDQTTVVSAAQPYDTGTHGKRNEIKLWDVHTKNERFVLTESVESVVCLSFSQDGKYFAAGNSEGTVNVWTTAEQHLQATLPGHSGQVHDVIFSPDGTVVVSADSAGTIRIWQLQSKQQSAAMTSHVGRVNQLAFSPDGRQIVSAGDDRTVRLWDSESGRQVDVLLGQEYPVTSVAFSPDGNQVASANLSDGTALVWPVAPERSRIVAIQEPICLAVSPDRSTIAVGRRGGLTLLDVNSNLPLKQFDAGQDVHSVCFSPDGSLLVAGGETDRHRKAFGEVLIWQLTEDTDPIRITAGIANETEPIISVAFTSTGSSLVTASYNGRIIIWDTTTWQPLRTVQGRGGMGLYAMTLLSGLDTIAWGDVGVNLWNEQADPMQKRLKLRGHVRSLSYHPGSRTLAGGANRFIYVWRHPWDSATDKPLRLDGHGGDVQCVAFSPDVDWLASGSKDKTIRLWELETGEPTTTLKGHTADILAMVFVNQRLLISAGADDTVRFWTAATDEEVETE